MFSHATQQNSSAKNMTLAGSRGLLVSFLVFVSCLTFETAATETSPDATVKLVIFLRRKHKLHTCDNLVDFVKLRRSCEYDSAS